MSKPAYLNLIMSYENLVNLVQKIKDSSDIIRGKVVDIIKRNEPKLINNIEEFEINFAELSQKTICDLKIFFDFNEKKKRKRKRLKYFQKKHQRKIEIVEISSEVEKQIETIEISSEAENETKTIRISST